jgi:hypothetical protein
MVQGRALGRHGFICVAVFVLSVGSLTISRSAPPVHANNSKETDAAYAQKPGNGEPKNGRWADTSNSAPTISGYPNTEVLQDSNYYFLPTAADPDGDPLTFYATNLPPWARIDMSNGRIFGTPGAGDIGLYSQITVGVSDGQTTTELPAFSIEVMAYADGVVTLSWVAPTENTDGSPLLDLAGYEFHWGPESTSYSDSVTVMNPGITTYVIDNLTAGTHYFAIRAINGQGDYSTFSNEAVKSIEP